MKARLPGLAAKGIPYMHWPPHLRSVPSVIARIWPGREIARLEAEVAAIEECTMHLSRACDDLRLFLQDDAHATRRRAALRGAAPYAEGGARRRRKALAGALATARRS